MKIQKNHPFIDTGASVLISTCIFTKNRSYIDSGTSIPTRTHKFTMLDHPKEVTVEAYMELGNSCSKYTENNQMFKIDVESPSLPEKHAKLFYHHVTRLFFTNKWLDQGILLVNEAQI